MNDAQALELLTTMVAIPSLSTAEGPLVAWLVSALASAGFDAHCDAAGNAIGVLGNGPETVVLLGHVDTVPGTIPVRIADGQLWGRGAVDAKGSLAALIVAASRAHKQNPARRIVVAGCVEEEAPSSKGAHALAAAWPAPAWCIVGEPSGASRVTLGYKGVLRATLALSQPSGHSAHAAATAAERGYAVWAALQADAAAFNAGRSRAFEQLLPTLLGVSSANDGLEDRCTLELSVRLPPELSPEAYRERLERVVGAPITVHGAASAYATPRFSPLVGRFTRALRACGHQPGYVLKTGTADLNVVGPAWGCPVVAYGPGDAALDHTPEERLPLAEYFASIAVLTHVLAAP